jgi:hypothetical protein
VAYLKTVLVARQRLWSFAFEGCLLLLEDKTVQETDSLRPGDLYLVHRSASSRLLTCEEVMYSTCDFVHGSHSCGGPGGKHPSYIHARDNDYSYNTWEAYKVLGIEDIPAEPWPI